MARGREAAFNGGTDYSRINRAFVYDARGQKFLEAGTQGGIALPGDDPVGAWGQWGAWSEVETEVTLQSGLVISNGRYYDAKSCRYLTMDDRFGNAYSDGDDGSDVMEWFQVLGMLPGTSAVIQMVYAYDAIGEGKWGEAGGHFVGVAANAVGAAAITSSIRSASRLSSGFASRLDDFAEGAIAEAKTMQMAGRSRSSLQAEFRAATLERYGSKVPNAADYQAHHAIPVALFDDVLERFPGRLNDLWNGKINGMLWRSPGHQQRAFQHRRMVNEALRDANSFEELLTRAKQISRGMRR
ncbi:MAG: hypothetical protein ABL949_15540 [Fimbriimonadaceae bacterium]